MASHTHEDLPQVTQFLAVEQDPNFLLTALPRSLVDELQRRFDLPEALTGVTIEDLPPDEAMAFLDELTSAAVAEQRRRPEQIEPHQVLARLDLPVYITTNPNNLMAQALVAGRRLAHGELEPAPTPPNVCPICRCDSFTLKGNRAICPICGQQATVEQVGGSVRLRFDPASSANHRWTPEGLRTHMSEWVMATGPRFLARRGEIKARRRPYRRMDMTWLCPPPSEGLPKK